jgi:hypothetical protein
VGTVQRASCCSKKSVNPLGNKGESLGDGTGREHVMKKEVPRYNGKEKKKVSKDICNAICMFIVYVCLSVIIGLQYPWDWDRIKGPPEVSRFLLFFVFDLCSCGSQSEWKVSSFSFFLELCSCGSTE